MNIISTDDTAHVLDLMGLELTDRKRAAMLEVTPNTLYLWRKNGMPAKEARQAFYFARKRCLEMASVAREARNDVNGYFATLFDEPAK